MKKIVIASACRTAIGKFGGTLANVPAAELGSIVIKEALNRANVKPEQVDHVYMGCVIQAGLGQNVARQASLKAGLPIETPAVTVNVVCGSGLTAAAFGTRRSWNCFRPTETQQFRSPIRRRPHRIERFIPRRAGAIRPMCLTDIIWVTGSLLPA